MAEYNEGDVIEFTLQGNFNSAVALRNIFHFEIDSVGVSASETAFDVLNKAANNWFDGIRASLVAMTHPAVRYTAIKSQFIRGDAIGTQNLFLIEGDEGLGTASGDAMPPYVAYGFRYQGAGGEQRNGYKRFGGVSEAFSTYGLPDGGINTLGANLSDDLYADVECFGGIADAVVQFNAHVVTVKKMADGLDPSDIVVINTWKPVGVLFYGITTQNTRKYGRGI